MDTKLLCSTCGKPLEANAPQGLCPACLMQGAFPTGTDSGGKAPRFTPPALEDLAPRFPQLELLCLVGQGGMGAVYKSEPQWASRSKPLKCAGGSGTGGAREFAGAVFLAQFSSPK